MINLIETTNYLKSVVEDFDPNYGLILGTGLGDLTTRIKAKYVLEYKDIPHFPVSTVESHSGRLIFGYLSGEAVICMQGRFHYYEGYSMQEVAYPVRVMESLGINKLFISNASGALNLGYKKGDLMIIEDHISLLLPTNPLIGKHVSGDRFPDMSEPYSKGLISKAQHKASQLGISNIHQGTYISITGPQLETRAEYRMLKSFGADAVGMSTVPEVIMARQLGLEVFAVSVITDICDPDNLSKVELSDILAAAAKAQPAMTALIEAML